MFLLLMSINILYVFVLRLLLLTFLSLYFLSKWILKILKNIHLSTLKIKCIIKSIHKSTGTFKNTYLKFHIYVILHLISFFFTTKIRLTYIFQCSLEMNYLFFVLANN